MIATDCPTCVYYRMCRNI